MSGLREHPDPILHEKCVPVGSYVDEYKDIIKEMEAMLFAYNALGLAAPQIGYGRRIITIADYCKYSDSIGSCLTMIDPTIHYLSNGTFMSEERCLSVPDTKMYKVRRHTKIGVIWNDINGEMCQREFEGSPAFVIQHEIDHLNGKLIIDYEQENEDE